MAKRKAAKPAKEGDSDAAGLIDARIEELGGWRGEALARVRALIHKADPDVVEEVKWRKPSNPGGVPVWSHEGILCTGEAYKEHVKLTFPEGSQLKDPRRVFNAGLEGARRAVDLREGDRLDEEAFVALVRQAVDRNVALAQARARPRGKAAPKVKLLSGGNPQIPKGEGDEPVQRYIAAMPGWKRALGERLDALIVRQVPGVKKAVKWNSPFYGVEGKGWFLSFHVFTRYVKVTFFNGTSLRPVPPGGQQKDARWIDVHEDDLDEKQMAKWVKQAAALPGWKT